MKIKLIHTVSILFLIVFFFAECRKDSAVMKYGDFPTEIGKIITYKCATAGCHNSKSYQGASGLDLTSFASLFRGYNSGSSVIPFRSDFSTFCNFINTYDDLGLKNTPTMPLNGNPLNREEVKLIKDWINNGAPDINGKIMWSDNPKRKKYYVLNQGCDVVTVFDAATQLPMRYITVGNKPGIPELPHMIRVSPDGQYWYVVFVANNILQKYRTSDDSKIGEVQLAHMLLPQQWNTIAISNDSKRAYCVSFDPGKSLLAVVDIENMRLIKPPFNAGNFINAHGVALNKTNDTIYVTCQTGNYIYKMDTSLIDPPSSVVIDGTKFPNNGSSLDPHEIMFSEDGSKYFVTCQKSNQVKVIQTAGDVLLKSIPTGKYPQEIARSNANNKIYVTCPEEPSPNPKAKGAVTVIDMITYQYNNYLVGYLPHGIAIDEKNGWVIVASRNLDSNGPAPHHTSICGRNGFVNYFDIKTMTLLSKKTEVASDPYSISITP